MKNTLLIMFVLMLFQSNATSQTNLLPISNLASTTTQQNFLESNREGPKSERGFLNIYLGAGVVSIENVYGFGGQFDVVLNPSKKISLGGLAAVQVIGEDQFTPMAAYMRLNLNKYIGLQGGYGWYMDDFNYNFDTAKNGIYGGLVVGGNRAKLEVSGYFPDGENYRIVIGTKIRIFKL